MSDRGQAGGTRLCAGSERSGLGEGRRYEVSITASDAYGNETPPVVIGEIRVPHDARQAEQLCPRVP